MNHKLPYNLSSDYEKLWKLIKAGNRIVCFVDFVYNNDKDVFLDICTAYIQDGVTHINVRGVAYGTYAKTYDAFEQNCKRNNLKYIEPTKPVA